MRTFNYPPFLKDLDGVLQVTVIPLIVLKKNFDSRFTHLLFLELSSACHSLPRQIEFAPTQTVLFPKYRINFEVNVLNNLHQ